MADEQDSKASLNNNSVDSIDDEITVRKPSGLMSGGGPKKPLRPFDYIMNDIDGLSNKLKSLDSLAEEQAKTPEDLHLVKNEAMYSVLKDLGSNVINFSNDDNLIDNLVVAVHKNTNLCNGLKENESLANKNNSKLGEIEGALKGMTIPKKDKSVSQEDFDLMKNHLKDSMTEFVGQNIPRNEYREKVTELAKNKLKNDGVNSEAIMSLLDNNKQKSSKGFVNLTDRQVPEVQNKLSSQLSKFVSNIEEKNKGIEKDLTVNVIANHCKKYLEENANMTLSDEKTKQLKKHISSDVDLFKTNGMILDSKIENFAEDVKDKQNILTKILLKILPKFLKKDLGMGEKKIESAVDKLRIEDSIHTKCIESDISKIKAIGARISGSVKLDNTVKNNVTTGLNKKRNDPSKDSSLGL